MIGPILAVGEDNSKRVELSTMLIALGYRVIEAESSMRALDLLRRRKNIAFTFIDAIMSDLSTSDLISTTRLTGISSPIIVTSREENPSLLKKILKAGAADYLTYPISPLRLGVTISNIALTTSLERELHYVRRQHGNYARFCKLFPQSSAMQSVIEDTKRAAQSPENLLIEGENGTGREFLANIAHYEGPSHTGQFSLLQCEPIHNADMEERLWTEDILPLFEAIEKGTICLNDINHLESRQQKRLHTYLKARDNKQDKENNFRLIALSTTPLEDLVNDGLFLPELYSQLSKITIKVPTLRELREDFATIAQRLVDHVITETGRLHVHGIAGPALALLMQYEWPGNISELENILFRAVLLSNGPLLSVQDFPQLTGNQFLDVQTALHSDLRESFEKSSIRFLNSEGHVRAFEDMERDVIERAIQHYKGRMSEVARRLRIGRSTLYRKLNEYAEANKPINSD